MKHVLLLSCLLALSNILWAQDTITTADDLIKANKQILEQEYTTDEPVAVPSTQEGETYQVDTENENTEESSENYNSEEYSRPDSFYLNRIDEDNWEKIKNDKDFIYTPPEKEKMPSIEPKAPSSGSYNLGWLKALGGIAKFALYGLVLFVIGFIIYHIVKNSEFNYFKRKDHKEENDSGSYEDVYTYTEWEKSLQDAIQNKNYRLAVRILYLQTLQKLHLSNYIKYEQQKTNWDYVNQLQANNLSAPFTQLTKYFDYVWYGHFTVDEKRFHELHNQFKHFQTDL